MIINISIPRVPVGPNGPKGLLRMHWSKRRKLKWGWETEILYALRTSADYANWVVSPATIDQRRRVTIRQYRKRLFDRDNLFTSCTPLINAMKGILIRDDSEKWLSLHVYQEKSRDERTEITVEDCT